MKCGAVRGESPRPATSRIIACGFGEGDNYSSPVQPPWSIRGRCHARSGRQRFAGKASAAATGNRDREEVSVYLDLRKSQPGSYFLSPTHEQHQPPSYYPLQLI